MSKFTCCECGQPADDEIEVDGTGRTACSKAHKDLLLGTHLPHEKRKGWYCRHHPRKAA